MFRKNNNRRARNNNSSNRSNRSKRSKPTGFEKNIRNKRSEDPMNYKTLVHLYNKINNSALVERRQVSDTSILFLETVLNKFKSNETPMQSKARNNYRSILGRLYRLNKNTFHQMFNGKARVYILLCNSVAIAEHFAIEDLVDINFNTKTMKYDIYPKDATSHDFAGELKEEDDETNKNTSTEYLDDVYENAKEEVRENIEEAKNITKEVMENASEHIDNTIDTKDILENAAQKLDNWY